MNDFDNWLLKNFIEPYNIELMYRFEYRESDNQYNLVPAEYDKAVAMAKLIRHLFLDCYTELVGKEFLQSYTPRIFFLVGTPAYNQQGSVVAGMAEGGIKITLFNINMLDFKSFNNIDVLNEWYFKTIHHEFAHILHQTKNYPTEFNTISPSDYQSASWVNVDEKDALKMGFVSAYASSEAQEDFVETFAAYVTKSEEDWTSLLLAAEEGAAKIKQKLEIVTIYLSSSWKIDINELRTIVLRRSSEVESLDLKTLD